MDTAEPGGGTAGRLWREVIDAAAGQCECRGECGRKHNDGGGRCKRLDTPHATLHAVSREPVPARVAATLPAAALTALCDYCHRSIDALRAAERAAALRGEAAAAVLF
jgi:hypothetical protein